MNIDWLWLAYNYVIDIELIDHIAFRGVTLFLFPTHTRCPRWIRCVSNNHTWRRAKRFAKRWRRLVRSLKSIRKSIENSRGSRKNCVCDCVIVQSCLWWLGLDLFERSNKESVTITYLPAHDELQYKGVLCLLAYVCVGLRFWAENRMWSYLLQTSWTCNLFTILYAFAGSRWRTGASAAEKLHSSKAAVMGVSAWHARDSKSWTNATW